MRIHIVAACHNRRDLTLGALDAALASCDKAGIDCHFILFDDGSTDGTAPAVSGRFGGRVQIVQGDGSAFWASGMSQAEAVVLEAPTVNTEDLILWLNDDTLIYADSVTRLLEMHKNNPTAIVASSILEPSNGGGISYGGYRRSGPHPLRYARVTPDATHSTSIDAFNGNLVLLPVGVARRLGGIDGEYSHALADIDYGIRAVQANVSILLAPGFYGTCERNVTARKGQSPLDEWRRFRDTKGGGHYKSLARILRKAAPRTWMAYIGVTYTMWWLREIFEQMRRVVPISRKRNAQDAPSSGANKETVR